jgi:hypothetical protein
MMSLEVISKFAELEECDWIFSKKKSAAIVQIYRGDQS